MKESSWGFICAISILIVGVSTMAFSTWTWANLYDWPAITAKLDRLAVLERKAEVYETMTDMNVGVWCGLAVHYDWLGPEDKAAVELIIRSEVHE